VCGYSPFESTRGDDGRLRLCEPSHLRALAPVQWPAAGTACTPAFRALVGAMLEVEPARRPGVAAVAEAARGLLEAAAGSGDGGRSGGAMP